MLLCYLPFHLSSFFIYWSLTSQNILCISYQKYIVSFYHRYNCFLFILIAFIINIRIKLSRDASIRMQSANFAIVGSKLDSCKFDKIDIKINPLLEEFFVEVQLEKFFQFISIFKSIPTLNFFQYQFHSKNHQIRFRITISDQRISYFFTCRCTQTPIKLTKSDPLNIDQKILAQIYEIYRL